MNWTFHETMPPGRSVLLVWDKHRFGYAFDVPRPSVEPSLVLNLDRKEMGGVDPQQYSMALLREHCISFLPAKDRIMAMQQSHQEAEAVDLFRSLTSEDKLEVLYKMARK